MNQTGQGSEPQVARRRNYRDLSQAKKNQLVDALIGLKADGTVSRFAAQHAFMFSAGIYHTSFFLPWNRRFIYLFEKELQRANPSITLPYWDSTVDQSPGDPLWAADFMGQFDLTWALGRWLSDGLLLPPHLQRLFGITPPTLATQAGYAAHLATTSFQSFSSGTEKTYHNPPHRWVGGAMRGTAAPSDPVFYLHHCWIDRMWAEWQEADGRARFGSFEEYVGNSVPGHVHFGSYAMDDPLPGIGGTPRGQFDYKALGYDYGL